MNSAPSRLSIAFSVAVAFLLSAQRALCFGICANCPPDPDTTPPGISVSSPVDGVTVTNPIVTVQGNAWDGGGLSRVDLRLENADGTGPYQSVPASWSVDVAGLIGGTNIVRIRAEDTSHNVSEAVVHIFYFQKTPISVTVAGPGTVTPDLNGQILQSGNYYQMKAKPTKDFVFGGWTGDITSGELTLNFIMRSNLVVQANFATNPFRPAAGTYLGVMTGQVEGDLKVVVSQKGKFSAKLRSGDGRVSRFLGTFLADGSYSGSIYRKWYPNNPLLVQLRLDIGGQEIDGTVMDFAYTGDVLATLKTKPAR